LKPAGSITQIRYVAAREAALPVKIILLHASIGKHSISVSSFASRALRRGGKAGKACMNEGRPEPKSI